MIKIVIKINSNFHNEDNINIFTIRLSKYTTIIYIYIYIYKFKYNS